MSPKEKAKEIFEKFQSIEDSKSYMGGQLLFTDEAKQCALIAVEEIEEALYQYGVKSMELQNMDSTFRYWQQVKTEIEKL